MTNRNVNIVFLPPFRAGPYSRVSLRAKRGNLITPYRDCFVACAPRNDKKGMDCFLSFNLSFCIFIFNFYIYLETCRLPLRFAQGLGSGWQPNILVLNGDTRASVIEEEAVAKFLKQYRTCRQARTVRYA